MPPLLAASLSRELSKAASGAVRPQVPRLRFEREGGLKEIEALRHAQVSTMITIRIVCIQLSEPEPSVYQRVPYAA